VLDVVISSGIQEHNLTQKMLEKGTIDAVLQNYHIYDPKDSPKALRIATALVCRFVVIDIVAAMPSY